MLRTCFALVVLVMFSFASADRVDDYVRAQMAKHHVPGLSLAVVKDGKIWKAKGYGYANLETKTLATPSTVYKIASISKQFFAAAIMLLQGDGALSLDDSITKYLDGAPESWRSISIRQVLTHTSGLVRISPTLRKYEIQKDADAIKGAYPVPLLFKPGEKFAYSNLGYQILGEIVHKASGKPWRQYLQERLFGPAGMSSTRPTSTTDLIPNRADGYEWTGQTIANSENWLTLSPSGAYLSTVLDMAKWDVALHGDRIIKKKLRESMWEPAKLNDGDLSPYGFGWQLIPWQHHARVHHDGELPGFESDFERFVDDGLSVIVLTNGSDFDCEGIALHIAGLCDPNLAPKRIADKDPEFTAKVGRIVDGFVNGKLDTSVFSADYAASLADGDSEFLSGILKELGQVKSTYLVDRYRLGQTDFYQYRVDSASDSALLLFMVDKGKISLIIPNQA